MSYSATYKFKLLYLTSNSIGFQQIIQDTSGESETIRQADLVEMPLLVYVSREKRPEHLYHFKAGALNVLV